MNSVFDTKDIPEFEGPESYPKAAEYLLSSAQDIGAVVIRECFDPRSIANSNNSIYRNDILPDESLKQGDQLLIEALKGTGFSPDIGYGIGSSLRYKNGRSMLDVMGSSRFPTAFTQVSSLKGKQSLYVLPGLGTIDQVDEENLSEIVDEYDRELRFASEATRRRFFSHQSTISQGDIALIAGMPNVTLASILGHQPKSRYNRDGRSEYLLHSIGARRLSRFAVSSY